MKIVIPIIIIIIVLTIVGYFIFQIIQDDPQYDFTQVYLTNNNTNKQISQECSIDTDCETPMEYLVQSRCPFSSACIDNQCKVVCGIYSHNPNINISESYPSRCSENQDCDCSEYLGNDLESCQCINENCLVVINQKKSFALSEPIAEFQERITKKPFGIHITPDTSPVQPEKFSGYHTAVDIEYPYTLSDVPVKAVADGEVVASKTISGYGGVVVIKHSLNNSEDILTIYGHLDDSRSVDQKMDVKQGTIIGYLGMDKTEETDFERRHLHFGIIKGDKINYKGYVDEENELENWYNPMIFY